MIGWFPDLVPRALSLRNLVSGYECERVFPAGVGPGSPSRDAAYWLPSRFSSLSVETRRRYGWLRMVFAGARLFRCSINSNNLKKNQNAPRPFEHPPVRGENMLGFILFCLFCLVGCFVGRLVDYVTCWFPDFGSLLTRFFFFLSISWFGYFSFFSNREVFVSSKQNTGWRGAYLHDTLDVYQRSHVPHVAIKAIPTILS